MNMQLILPTGTLESYVQSLYQIPILGAEEERELVTRFREKNDLDAARHLVLAHLRFVVRIAKGYRGYGLSEADLIQEGSVGLMKAVKRFDPEVGVRLVSFAVHWIRAEIHEFIIRNWRIVKIATTKAQRKLFFNLRSSKKNLGWLTRTELDTVTQDLGVKRSEVLEMERRLSNQDTPYDSPTSGGLSEETGYIPAHYLQDQHRGPEQQIELDQLNHQTQQALEQAIGDLDERSRDIIVRRWLAEKKTTLQTLAAEYGISAERIRQIESDAMKKLRLTVLQAKS